MRSALSVQASTASPTMGSSERGSGPVVVLVHGIPGSSAGWAPTAEVLASAHRVVTVDLLGFGASSRPRSASGLQASAQAEALARLLDDRGVRGATVAGHDFGGPVTAHLARQRPDLVDGLVWLSGNAFPDTPVPFPLSLVRLPFVGTVADRVLFSRPSLRLMMRQATREGAVSRPSPVGDRSEARSVRLIFGSALRDLERFYTPVVEALSQLSIPATVVWGDRDPFFPVEQGQRTASLIPGAELVVLEGAGHFLPDERPHEVAGHIAAVARQSRSL